MDKILFCIELLSSSFFVWFVFFYLNKKLETPHYQSFFIKHKFLHPNTICWWRIIASFPLALGYIYFGEDYVNIEQSGVLKSIALSLIMIVYVFLFITDGLDGIVARKCIIYKDGIPSNLVTEEGKSLDPLADKFLALPPFFIFYFFIGNIEYKGLFWILFVSDVLGQIYRKAPKVNPSANMIGKIKMCVQIVTLIYLSLNHRYHDLTVLFDISYISEVLMGVSTLFALVSFLSKIPREVYKINIANLLSLSNLICGILATIYVWNGYYLRAFQCFTLAQIFDAVDGIAARKFGCTRIGKYLDSFCDLVSFCVFPAIYMLSLYKGDWILGFVVLIFLFSGSYRLYRYTFKDKIGSSIPKGNFLGLPTPAGAMMLLGISNFDNKILIISSILVVAYLQISKIRYKHFTAILQKILSTHAWKVYFIIAIMLITIITAISSVHKFLLIAGISSIIYCILAMIMADRE